MQKPKLIVISGKRYSGKDTVAKIIREYYITEHNIEYTIVSFGDSCKRETAERYGLSYERLCEDIEYKEQHRYLLTRTYHEDMNRYGDQIWVERLFNRLDKNIENNSYIISDLRRGYELDYINANYGQGCKIIRVVAPDKIKSQCGFEYDESKDKDITETDLDNVELCNIISNDEFGIDNLRQKVITLLKN